MGREIKFRGLRLDGKGLAYGSLIQTIDGYCYIFSGDADDIHTCFMNLVNPESIEQFIGVTDKNVIKVFEGDILENPKGDKGLVVFHEAVFYLKSTRRNGSVIYIQLNEGFISNKKIIGNLHENPDLL